MGVPATTTEKFPILVSAPIGLLISQSVNAVQMICHCFDTEQLAGINFILGLLVAFGIAAWQYRNVWSKASVAKVLDAHVPTMTTAEAQVIAQEGPAK